MAIYSPTKYEIDTVEIFYYLKKRKIDIFYPRVSSDLLEFGLVDKLDDLNSLKDLAENLSEKSVGKIIGDLTDEIIPDKKDEDNLDLKDK